MSKLLPDVSLCRLVFRPNYARLQRSQIAASGKGDGREERRKGKSRYKGESEEKCSGVKVEKKQKS